MSAHRVVFLSFSLSHPIEWSLSECKSHINLNALLNLLLLLDIHLNPKVVWWALLFVGGGGQEMKRRGREREKKKPSS